MAFNTGASLDSILLRGLNFRYPNNAPVSSFYSLYANGAGQTYWSNAILGDNLSTVSTSLGIQYSSFSYFISSINTVNLQQTSNISTLYRAQFSSVVQLLSNDATTNSNLATLNNQFNNFVTYTYGDFVKQTNDNFLNIDTHVNSTLNSAVASASSYGPVYSSISTVQGNLNASASSLSTSIMFEKISSYGALTNNYIAYTNAVVISTVSSFNYQISSINSSISSIIQLNTFSSTITSQLVSSSQNLSRQISSLSTYVISTINDLSTQTNVNFLSSTSSLTNRVSSLEGLSTNLSSITYKWISSFYSTNIYYNNSTTYSYINQNSNAISTINSILYYVAGQASTISTFTNALYISGKSTNASLTNQVSDLWFAYSTLSASSILVNIWSSFYNLEIYTSSVIGQRYSSITQYENNVYRSTVFQNISTTASYFNYYVSTLYASTLSTLIPSTIYFTSSMVSTLYSTQYFYMISTLNSSMTAIQSTYTSTMYGFQSSFIASTQYLVDSTLTSTITVPAASTFSTITYQQKSTFSTITGNYNVQSTLFYSSYGYYTSTFSSLLVSTIAINNLAISSLSTVTYLQTTQLTTNSTVFGQQLSTQALQFGSTISTYNSYLVIQANSAYNFVVVSTVNSVSTASGVVTASTITTYNAFVAGLNQGVASLGTSSLYTNTTLTFSGSNYTQFMNFSSIANYYVLVSSIANNGTYRLTYDRGGITNLNFRRGIISIDINTVGQNYTSNGGQLRFDVNTLGIPTSVWKNVSPLIGNSDYLAQYEYTIMNNIVYTNLIGLYPRVRVVNPIISTIFPSVQWSNAGTITYDPSTVMRGSPLIVSWSNYSFFPYSQVGELPFEPQIVLETYVNGTLYNEYGPYPFSQSTASITAPYIVGSAGGSLQTTTVSMYILGYPTQPTTTTFKILQPTFDSIVIRNGTAGSFVGGYELVAQTDGRNYPLNGLNATATGTVPGFTTFSHSNIYSSSNLTTNVINRAGAAGSPRINQRMTYALPNQPIMPTMFTELTNVRSYPDFVFNMPNYQDLIAISSLGGTVTFSLNNGVVSTTFLAANFTVFQSTFGSNTFTLYEAFNTSIVKTTNTFFNSTPLVTALYSLSTPSYVSTTNNVTINPFVGPFGFNSTTGAYLGADTVTVNIANIGLTNSQDPVSSLLFYNVINTPITSVSTANTLITGIINTNNLTYIYTVSTTVSSSVQLYKF